MSYAESKRVPYSEPLDPAKAALARLENKLRRGQGVTRPGPDVARERFSRLRRGGPGAMAAEALTHAAATLRLIRRCSCGERTHHCKGECQECED